MTAGSVSVIVPARNASASLPRALAALESQTTAPAEVIVVDDGSRDDTAAIAERSPVVSVVVRGDWGEGPGIARNAGVRRSSGELLAFTDADCRPDPEWLRHGVAALEHADLIQGAVRPDPGEPLGPFDRTVSVGRPSGLFESANLLVRRDLFDRIGGFPPGLRRRGDREGSETPLGEDVVFGWSARRAGARVEFSERAVVYHEVVARGIAAYAAERRRLELFPVLAEMVPELRDAFFYRHRFLSRRSASFDLALAGALLALLRSSPVALLVAIPYLSDVVGDARRWGWRRAPAVALGGVLADAVGALSLARGSARAGSLLI